MPQMLRTAYEAGITKEFLPEFDRCMEMHQNNPHHCYTVGEHILKGLGISAEAFSCLRVLSLVAESA